MLLDNKHPEQAPWVVHFSHEIQGLRGRVLAVLAQVRCQLLDFLSLFAAGNTDQLMQLAFSPLGRAAAEVTLATFRPNNLASASDPKAFRGCFVRLEFVFLTHNSAPVLFFLIRVW